MGASMSFTDRVQMLVMKFVSLKGIQALKDGVTAIIPLTLIGSIFLLLAQIPYEPFNIWVAGILGENWTDPLWQVYESTFNIMALVACFSIAYSYVKNQGHEPLMAGVIATTVFLTTISGYVLSESGEKVENVISKDWTGGKGMVTAIVIGLIVGAVYTWFLDKKITIKMPEGVPQGVVNAFTALIPGTVIITGAMAVYALFKFALNTTMIEWIYAVIQTPLQGLSDTPGGVLAIAALIPTLWWFGIHGNAIVSGVMTGLLTANTLENQAILKQMGELTIANGGHVVTQQFLDSILIITGSGITVGVVLAMLFASKSAQCKTLGKLALVPAIFNINEPVIFGFPIVMNPYMFIPFVAAPTIASMMAYAAISTGMVPLFTGVMVPWTTPPIISGLIIGGWRMALLQVAVIAMSTGVYYPFFKKQDEINLKGERAETEDSEMSQEAV